MDKKANVILAAPPLYTRSALMTGVPVAHMAYRIGRGFHLYRADIPPSLRGGIMVLDTADFSGGGPVSILASEIIGECQERNYTGIVLDTREEASPMLLSLAGSLSSAASRYGIRLYVSELFADVDDSVHIIISTAISGGTLLQRLEDACERYGADRLALEIERLRMDFSIPAASGEGKDLSMAELDALMKKHRSQFFFSQELCTYYFSYRENGKAHFVLYDNSSSIRYKLFLSEKTGIGEVFLFYPQIKDIVEEIIRR